MRFLVVLALAIIVIFVSDDKEEKGKLFLKLIGIIILFIIYMALLG